MAIINFKILALTFFTFLLTGIQLQAQDFSADNKSKMRKEKYGYGIEGRVAPELSKNIQWVDENGVDREPVQLADHKGKFKVIYGFQSWCPGCHSIGLPALKKMSDALEDSDKVAFFAIQTVFEGAHTNTKEKLNETQDKYDLKIPFGHDKGNNASGNRSITMRDYRTGGTPWFIFVDQEGKVVFNDYHINLDAAIEYLKAL